LVVCQAALSLVLLATSGLLTLALHNLERFKNSASHNRGAPSWGSTPKLAGYRPEQLTSLYGRIHDSLASIAGISVVAICTYSPLSDNDWVLAWIAVQLQDLTTIILVVESSYGRLFRGDWKSILKDAAFPSRIRQRHGT
jgi:hypothetical protein